MSTTQILYGPLTAFNPPSSCFNEIWLNARSDIVLGDPHHANCKPSGWNTAVEYSPALCPTGYTSASGQVTASESVTETMIACCPSDFIADPGTYHCVSHVTNPGASIAYTYLVGQSTATTTVAITGQNINAHSVVVRYQSSDIPLLSPTSSSNPTSTATSSDTATNAASSTSSTTPTPASSSQSGLSTGAKIGIGIGAAIAAILVLVFACLFYCARRRKKANALSAASHEKDHLHPEGKYDHDYPLHEKNARQAPVELLATSTVEMDGNGRGGGAGASGPTRSELPGS